MTAPLLLLPGTLCDASLWSHAVTHLAEIAAVSVADVTQAASLAELAQQVLAAAPARFALAGLSFGGILAFEILRQAPERVDRLALLSTNARPLAPAQQAQWEDLAVALRQLPFAEIVATRWLALVSAGRTLTAAVRAAVERMALACGAETLGRQIRAQLERPDSRPGLARISCPTLVVAGREDPLCPLALHAEIAAQIPGAHLVVVEQCGHYSPLEQPQAVTALLRYWWQAA